MGQCESIWHEVEIRCDEAARDAVCALLLDRGSTGLVEGEDGALRASFPPVMSRDAVRERVDLILRTVRAEGLLPGEARVSVRAFPDQDWNEIWKASFVPIDVGEDIVIVPPWLAEGYGGGRYPLYIDPGMAFGTGHHPTTRDCIRAVSRCAALLPGRGAALDMGTGTGVLAIHAALAGFEPVFALDVDPVAVDASRRNVLLNAVGDTVRVEEGGFESLRGGPFALITANLLLNILTGHMARFRELLAPAGFMVLSGILDTQEEELREAVALAGFTVAETFASDEWRTLVAAS